MLCWNRRNFISNIKDLIGEKFGKLYVIERLPNYKNSKTYYKCICDCGEEYIVYGYYLTSGRRVQCTKCSSNERGKQKRKDRIGYRFGKLVVLDLLYNYNNSGNTHAKCQCDCGNIKIIDINNLTHGRTKSCGCEEINSRYTRKHFIDITNQKFGLLTVVKKLDKKYVNGSVLWECLCDCGGTTCTNYTNLKTGQVRSCGCLHSSKWETMIGDYLKELFVDFETQKRFNDCTNPQKTDMLPFDFYIPNKNLIIEYDGEHHFHPVKYWGGEEKFKITQQNDKIKNEYCKIKNITLLRLPYTLSEIEIKEKIFNILNP